MGVPRLVCEYGSGVDRQTEELYKILLDGTMPLCQLHELLKKSVTMSLWEVAAQECRLN